MIKKRKRNREKDIEYNKTYRVKNKESIKKYKEKYRSENREKSNKHQKIYRIKNKEIVNKKSQEYAQRLKKAVYDFYGNKCACCSLEESSVLQIDHVNNDGYKDRDKRGRKIAGAPLYLRIAKQGFPNIYQILCANCNFSKRIRGTCYHRSNHL